MSCKGCQYGSSPDPMSDICDGCRHDPDTGWGGFTDHSIGKHFNSEEEADAYYAERRSGFGCEGDDSDEYE